MRPDYPDLRFVVGGVNIHELREDFFRFLVILSEELSFSEQEPRLMQAWVQLADSIQYWFRKIKIAFGIVLFGC
jgi:hypothetical protein